MKHRDFLTTALRTALILPLMLVLCTAVSGAAEIDWPKPSYEGEELAKVRAWEKEWAGKRIDASNIAEVKEYLPAEFYNRIEKWGENYWFDIVPYEHVPPSAGDIALTKKYWGTVTVDENEALQNYISGRPFPEPKTGIEMAYNHDNKNMGDSLKAWSDAWLIDGKRGYDRRLYIDANMMWWSGRREVEPVPEFTPNNKGIYRISNSMYIEPASLRGNRSMSIVWKDRTRDWASYSFSSATRRITRRSTNMRQSTLAGTDVTYNDDIIYSWVVNHNDYKLAGTKDVLIARHADFETIKENHIAGEVINPGEKREMTKVHVIEVKNKDPNYVYGKEVWYHDNETGWHVYADKYDKRGQMWKTMDTIMYVLTSEFNGTKCPHLCMVFIVDVQRKHATGTASNAVIGRTDKQFQPEFYSLAALQKLGY